MDTLLTLQKTLLSALLGSLVGLEREYARQHGGKEAIPIGIRTFSFIGVLGMASVLIGDLVSDYSVILLTLGGVLLLFGLTFYARYKKYGDMGLTTYFAGIITFIVGLLVGFNEFLTSIILTVTITSFLFLREELHNLAIKISQAELKSTIIFLIIALVVFPLLPNEAIDPWGLFNPFKFWFIVVFISGFQFASYVLLKVTSKGLNLTSFLGGFISSTNVTVSLIAKVKRNKTLRQLTRNPVILAISASLMVDVIIFSLLVNDLSVLLPYILSLLISTLIVFAFYYRRDGRDNLVLEFENPFTLISALKLAGLIVLFTSTGTLLIQLLNQSFIYPVVALNAFISTNTALATIASLYGASQISEAVTVQLSVMTSIITVLGKLVFLRVDKQQFKSLVKPLSLWSGLILVTFLFIAPFF